MYAGVPMNGPNCGEERLVGQPLAAMALATPKSMTLGTGPPSCIGDEDVRGLEVAVDDALLVRVLDALAELDEQLEPLADRQAAAGRSSSVIGSPRTNSITK